MSKSTYNYISNNNCKLHVQTTTIMNIKVTPKITFKLISEKKKLFVNL